MDCVDYFMVYILQILDYKHFGTLRNVKTFQGYFSLPIFNDVKCEGYTRSCQNDLINTEKCIELGN